MTPFRTSARTIDSRLRLAAKRALSRLAGANYYSARAYRHLRLKRSFDRGKIPLFIYQMGKVGSRTLWESLRAADPGLVVWHVHYLSDEILGKLDRLYKKTWPEGNPSHLWQCEFLRARLDEGLQGLRVVTLTRDPIARNISSFFQSLAIERVGSGSDCNIKSVDYGFDITINPARIDDLLDLFYEKFDHETPLVFFDREMQGVLGVDVFDTDFPKARGYQIYHGDRADVLVLKLESLDCCANEAMKTFLGIENFSLLHSNIGRDKDYGFIYDALLDRIRVSDSYMQRMYGSKYAQHFYSREEIEAFEGRWHT